eukprot:scaffold3.g6548.t1
MDSAKQAALAALVLADVQQLRERAEREGVTAYLSRPVQRERPNQRFLINTLRGVQQANRRVEEEEMWAVRQVQLEREEEEARRRRERGRQDRHGSRSREERRRGSCSRSRSAGRGHGKQGERRSGPPEQSEGDEGRWQGGHSASSSERSDEGLAEGRAAKRSRRSASPAGRAAARPRPDGHSARGEAGSDGLQHEGALADEQVAAMLASRRPRGRGALGSRMDEAGPYMDAGAGAGELANEDVAVVRRAPVGPARPEWLQQKLGRGDWWDLQQPPQAPGGAAAAGLLPDALTSSSSESSSGGSSSDSEGSAGSRERRRERRRSKAAKRGRRDGREWRQKKSKEKSSRARKKEKKRAKKRRRHARSRS